MKNNLLFLGLLGFASLTNAYTFRPENTDVIVNPNMPVLYNISESQTLYTNDTGTNSYWSSSFVTGSNNRQYLLLSHTLAIPATGAGYHRSSILDLTSMTSYKSYVAAVTVPPSQGHTFSFETDGYKLTSLTTDNLSTMHTTSDRSAVTFNLTFSATSKALFNGATGQFTYGSGPTSQWALPACHTTGSLTIANEEIHIRPEESFTWYERQWGAGAPFSGNWTWFQVTLDNADTKASIWIIDNEAPYRRDRFATLRMADGGVRVLPVVYEPDFSRVWTSGVTGLVYPLQWRVEIGDEGYLLLQSTVEDQEMAGDERIETAYEGFMNFTGVLNGNEVSGFGLVEMVTLFE
ncbi:kievitone hydratase [Aspergillus karnatakaensis]|uniref:kievitone hydratase n=1 Tax=Aspergillus karnatakaensis TaxID=1810916 RepID=UPI003CCD13BD